MADCQNGFMERGRIVESGNPQNLAQQEGWHSRYKRLEDHGWQIHKQAL